MDNGVKYVVIVGEVVGPYACECGEKAKISGYYFSEVPSCISQFVDPQFLCCMACAGKKCIEFRKDNIGIVWFIRRGHLERALGSGIDFSTYFEDIEFEDIELEDILE